MADDQPHELRDAFRNAYRSLDRLVLANIGPEFGDPVVLGRLQDDVDEYAQNFSRVCASNFIIAMFYKNEADCALVSPPLRHCRMRHHPNQHFNSETSCACGTSCRSRSVPSWNRASGNTRAYW